MLPRGALACEKTSNGDTAGGGSLLELECFVVLTRRVRVVVASVQVTRSHVTHDKKHPPQTTRLVFSSYVDEF